MTLKAPNHGETKMKKQQSEIAVVAVPVKANGEVHPGIAMTDAEWAAALSADE